MNKLVKRILVSLILPVVLLIVVPTILVLTGGSGDVAFLMKAPWTKVAALIGGALVVVGLGLVAATVPLFLQQRDGTIMPWAPAEELIVEGVYRHVRNPMHAGVFCMMLGEGLILRSTTILAFAIFAIVLHLFYIPLSEERGLEKRFGEAYRTYTQNVPRWIPRLTPWRPEKR